MDYHSFLSDYGQRSQLSIIREHARLLNIKDPNMMLMAGGIPNPRTFPFESMKIKLRDGSYIELENEIMERALQYGPSDGFPQMLDEARKLVKTYHNPPDFDRYKFCMCTGSQEALNNIFKVLFDPGDYVVVPNPVYCGVLDPLSPLRVNLVGVTEDHDGMKADDMRKALQKMTNDQKVKAIYVNPNSSNPGGTSYSLQRRKEIYKIAQEFNLIIIEDDAYYFVSFKQERPPSFLALDTDGRVIRFDSFSKVISPGMRLGFVCGPPTFVSKIECCIQTSTQQASALAQMIIYSLLKKWGNRGFKLHCASVSAYYKNQALCMADCAKKWLTGLAEWHIPDGGMFFWIKILNVKDTAKLVFQNATSKGVIVLPGKFFVPNETDSPYLRISYSLIPQEKMNEAFKRLASAVREHLNM